MDQELAKAFDTAMEAIEVLMAQLQRDGHPNEAKEIRQSYDAIDKIRDDLEV